MSGDCGGCQGRFGTTARTLCVRERADLARLLRRRPRYDSIRVVAALPADDGMRWERRLFALYDECGCDAGAKALLVMFGAAGVRAWLQPAPLGARAIALVVASCIAAGAAGKLGGIALARWRLRAVVRDLGEVLDRGPGAHTTPAGLRPG